MSPPMRGHWQHFLDENLQLSSACNILTNETRRGKIYGIDIFVEFTYAIKKCVFCFRKADRSFQTSLVADAFIHFEFHSILMSMIIGLGEKESI